MPIRRYGDNRAEPPGAYLAVSSLDYAWYRDIKIIETLDLINKLQGISGSDGFCRPGKLYCTQMWVTCTGWALKWSCHLFAYAKTRSIPTNKYVPWTLACWLCQVTIDFLTHLLIAINHDYDTQRMQLRLTHDKEHETNWL